MKDKKRIVAVPDKRGKKLKRKVRLYMGLVNRTRFKKTVVTGECRFCGQQVMIGHEVPQDEADRIAWKYCGCDGAARELEKEDQYDAAREWVAEEFGGDTAMTALLLDAIEAVRIRYGGLYADSVRVTVGNTTYGVKYNDERGVIVKKMTKRETEEVF